MGSNVAFKDRIVKYYEETYWHYRTLWLNPNTLAMHYGYWDSKARTHRRSLVRLIEVMAEQVPVRPGMTILDAGCGVGGSSIWLAKHYPVQVYGITLVPQQRDLASRYARKHGVADRVEFSLQDYTKTEFKEETFDLIWATESLVHAEDKRAFFREAYRILKPGGSVVLTEYLRREPPYDPEQQEAFERWLRCWAMPNLATWNELRQYVLEEGFVDFRHRDLTPFVWRSSRRMAWLTYYTYPVVAVLRLLGRWSAVEEENYAASRLQYQLLRQGIWRYGLISAQKP
jgi:tocopherol O-methyltransferase